NPRRKPASNPSTKNSADYPPAAARCAMTTRRTPRKSTTPTKLHKPHKNSPAGSGHFPPGQQKPHTSKNEESMSKRTHTRLQTTTNVLINCSRGCGQYDAGLGQCPKCGTVIYTPRA